MVRFDPYRVVLGRQPPSRVRYCIPPRNPNLDGCAAADNSCHGAEASCLVCGFAYCEAHVHHRKRTALPVDAWRSVRRRLHAAIQAADSTGALHTARQPSGPLVAYVLGGRVRHPAPPVVVAYCRPPTTRNVDLPCAYPAKTCTTGSTACHRCHFTFCDYHLTGHTYRLVLPRPTGIRVFELFQYHIERAAEAPKSLRPRGIQVRVPPLELMP